ncbi:MAG: hypothetical protein AAGA11_05700 [Pseudomonadota bacterium]
MTTDTFTDDQLTAYLDGELEPSLAATLEARLATDGELGARLEALSFDQTALRQAFDAVLAEAPAFPEAVLEPAAPAEPHRGVGAFTGFAAAAVLVACLSSLVTLWATRAPSDERRWFDYVAAYQALYTTDTLVHVTTDGTTRAAELERVSGAIGLEIPLQAVEALPNLHYKRAQVLGFEGAALAQLTFLTADGAPIAICIIGTDQADDTVQTAMLEGMASERWSDGEHAFLVIGGADQSELSGVAEAFRQRI